MNKDEFQAEVDAIIYLKALEVEDHDCKLSPDDGCEVCDERMK